jgi:Spy/CpxP family protein refolding chaperone
MKSAPDGLAAQNFKRSKAMKTKKMAGVGAIALGGLNAVGGAALVGSLHFAGAQPLTAAKQNGPYAARVHQLFSEVEQGLKLTRDQKLRIKAILQKAVPQGRALYNSESLTLEQKRMKLQELRFVTQAKLRQVFTAEQKQKIVALRAGARERGHTVLQKIAKDLQLTATQQERLKPVLEKTFTQIRALHNDMSLTIGQKLGRLRQIHASTQAQVKAVLTPAQQRKLQAIKAEITTAVRAEIMQRIQSNWVNS